MEYARVIQPWFQSPDQLTCFVSDLIMAELAAIRRGLPLPASMLADAETAFGESGLHLDSLEIMALSIALSRAIHLDESNLDENLFSQPSLANWLTIALKSLSVFSESISFKTSGSVGLKKYHRHHLAQLEQEAQYLGQLFAGRKRILRAVASHHIYGFIFTVLLPRYLEPSAQVIDIRGLSANALQSQLCAGDLIIAYPEFWQYANEANMRFPPDIIGINSSGPCPIEIGLNLLDKHLSGFYEVYGASETAGIGWRDHPTKAYTLFPFWQKAVSETEITRVLADGNSLTLPLQDDLHWSSATQFVVKGRLDSLVQIGGINVSLSAVRAKLVKHPSIKDAVVRMMRSDEGSRLKAFIVLMELNNVPSSVDNLKKASHAEIVDSIQHYITTHLSTAERPKALTFGLNLPLNHLGKPTDWTIERVE